MHQVTHGHSWSGQERNVCYLNKGDGTFANTSFVSGLDHQDDGRAIGLVDWDRDGDLDVWLRNRTAPRLRLMRNDQAQVASWISFTLEGVQCNRDAIGAVVQASHTLTKSLRAGEFFMSQGSKSIHFGLGQNPSIEPIRVLWPGGDWETFPNVKPNQRYHLRQGTGKATPQNALESPVVPTAPLEPVTFGSQATIILPVKLPLFPSFRYRDQALQLKTLQPSTKGRLVVLWSSTCLTCQKELQKLSLDLDQYTQAGIKVLTLATDPLESSADSYTLMDKLAWPLPWGFVDQTTLAKFEKWQQTLFDRAPTLTVPLTLVLDAENKVLALHRGPLANPVDVTALANLTAAERHAASPPFAGRWFTNPVPPAYVYEDFARQFEAHAPDDTLFYLEHAAMAATPEKRASLHSELATKHEQFAKAHAESQRINEATKSFEKALSFAPNSAQLYHNYGIFLAELGQLETAQQLLTRAQQLAPQSAATTQALDLVQAQLAKP